MCKGVGVGVGGAAGEEAEPASPPSEPGSRGEAAGGAAAAGSPKTTADAKLTPPSHPNLSLPPPPVVSPSLQTPGGSLEGSRSQQCGFKDGK